MQKHTDQRIGVFIDVGNMYHSAKNLYNARVNFKAILETAIADRKLIRAIAYVVKSNSVEEESFFEALEKQGFELKMKDLQVFAGGAKKGDWDVGMAVDAIKSADKLDVVVLVTGDGDFVPLVTYLDENKGCVVEVIAFGETASGKLKEAADDFTDLGGDLNKYLLRTRATRAPLRRSASR
ncbi:NYN domain-containing protein [Candidatus Uhrbacteria bacterium]|nr:NYN domain-containing protein [Candidatus Uhrbacteria bacterium]